MSFVCQTYNKKLLSSCFFCFFLLVIFILSGGSHGRSLSPAEQAVNNPGTDSRQQYKSAKDYYYRLERDTSFGKDRANWLVGIRKFRKIYQADTKSVLAPSCLYMMGRMYRRMYKQFNLPIDIDEAVSSFNEVASNFSNNSLGTLRN